MSSIGKAVCGWILAALVAVAGAWAAEGVAMQGEYGKVRWTTWVDKKGYSGYLFVTRQPNDTTYLYYVVQCGNEPPASGYGLIPNDSLRRNRTGVLELSLDTSGLRGFVTHGAGAAGPLSVFWWPKPGVLSAFTGTSGTRAGRVDEVRQGTWTSASAVATGVVLEWKLGDEQSAEIGTAFDATNQIGARN